MDYQMHFKKPFIFFFLCLLPLWGQEEIASKTTYIYEKKKEGRSYKTTWVVEKKEREFYIKGVSGGGKTFIISSYPMNTHRFSFKSHDKTKEYSIVRKGSYLIATLKNPYRTIYKEFKIGNRLWLQEFDFSFRPFILSKNSYFKFYIVHPKKLSLHHMIATKENEFEDIQINHKHFHAIKVKVTLTGLKKLFWKADLWFEKETGDLLKYVANEGPNTPLSIITLFSKFHPKNDDPKQILD